MKAEWWHTIVAVVAAAFVLYVMQTHAAGDPGLAGALVAAAPAVIILATSHTDSRSLLRWLLWLGWAMMAAQVVTAVLVLVTGGPWFFVFPRFPAGLR